MRFVASEGWYPDKGGTLTSPRIPASTDPLAYYRLRFRSRTTQKGYWAVFTQDAAGANQVDDAYAAVYPSTDWLDNEVVVRNRVGATTLSITFQGHAPIQVADLTVVVIDATEAAACADRRYASLPQLTWTPPTGRWQHLPRTHERLRSGGDLRIVQLGDSIINDTNNGNWDALVRRRHPAARLHMITSVRGSTGCWYYRESEHFAAYVTAQKPELLIIGGISHQRTSDDPVQSVANVREVALRARDQLGCEVLLMSGPMAEDWRTHDPATPDVALPAVDMPPVPAFYLGLEAMAAAERIAFLDCHRAWHRYLGASGKPWQWFHRDRVHADDRGKQILARVLDRWFAI
jgi:hypothetical protein